ncbi:MAG: efflux RND transporter periplasmic adaptor subunit [Verrucomicrobia bacterium]|nr:efflux RND transporter periplasmic adaptor subunit [Verrucomicrobiota bacterium]
MKGITPTITGLLFAFLLVGCGHKSERARSSSLPTASVRVQTVESKKRVATEEVVGTVRAKLRSVIEAKVSGKVDQMLVVPGQQVKAGELLATIDAREVQARLDQAVAVRQQTEADLKRFASLLEQKILAQSEYDNAQAKARVAQAALVEAETMVSYTKVTAPFAGVITRKHADVGDLAAPGKPLLDMEDSRALRLEADVPEAVVGKLTLGDKLPVHISALETELEGVVSEIAPAADSGSRTFLVKLDLAAQPGLRAGQFGRVAMPVGETTALRVPATAVVQRGQMEIVFVVSDNQAQLRLVKTGKRIGSEWELVSGVAAGEKVVVENPAGLIDGQPLTVKP